MNQSGGVGIADGRFEVLSFIVQDLLNLLLQAILLRADFRAQGEQRATEHTAALGLDLSLKPITIITILPDALKWWNGWRKQRVKLHALPLPLRIDCRNRQVRLGVEEVIKAPLFNPRLLADLVDRCAAVGAGPDEFADG